ncbi:hypothetical protein [Nostoc sp.]
MDIFKDIGTEGLSLFAKGRTLREIQNSKLSRSQSPTGNAYGRAAAS